MNKAIITIARQYGSGGREIGAKLAEKQALVFLLLKDYIKQV